MDIFIESTNIECENDINSISIASCFPNGNSFTPSNYNISTKSINTNEFQNGIFLCLSFCDKIYKNCGNMILKQYNVPMNEFYDNSIDFCKKALGSQIKKDVYTDKCFTNPSISHNIVPILLYIHILSFLIAS